MDDTSITFKLFELSEKNILDYCNKLIPGSLPVIGVKLPTLRKMAKSIAGEDYQRFMNQYEEDYFEQLILKAYVIGYAKDDVDTILRVADSFTPKIHDWAVNDAFCQNFSIARKYPDKIVAWLEKYADRCDEFSQRIVAVMMMSHLLQDEYIELVLNTMNRLQNDGYYAKMGVAWCVATAYAKYPTETMRYLKENSLSDWTFNKAIQKMRESYRVSDEDKLVLTKMKR